MSIREYENKILNGTLFQLRINGDSVSNQVTFEIQNHNRFNIVMLELFVDSKDNGWESVEQCFNLNYPIGSLVDFDVLKSEDVIYKSQGIFIEQKTKFEMESPISRIIKIQTP